MNDLLKKLWAYGTTSPLQRIGLIILSIGALSYLSWVFTGYHHGYDYTDPGLWINVIFDHEYFPGRRDFLFFHLYLYLIPIGILMTWGRGLLIKLKSWIMSGSKKNPVSMEVIHFKDNEAAFEMISKYMDTSIIQDKPVVAISMQDMKKPSEPIMIKVAGDPPFFAHTATHFAGSHLIKKGDLLSVMPFKKTENITSYMKDDERKHWLFLVVSEINPKYHSTRQMWSIKRDFLMEDLEREKSKNKP
ncbi:hypothetical protein [Acinetobacter haemolyticus]|uniref:hypothetical protein n=1 Tax=Acinetobacter haemolyticus TaxID=29430 RepID=UPI001372B6DC|nr:hypothetical protein [Acinetobacter haemolyticus]NAR60041.1 hypothetical protein [Acinetobacter haemolyticus]NAR92855.1 hypothetical protein [Acinetobacter haemolyticus]